MAICDVLLVPQGAEYEAVRWGLGAGKMQVVAIPAGPDAAGAFVAQWAEGRSAADRVVLAGLCGSLNPRWSVGQVVCYRSCLAQWRAREVLETDLALLNALEVCLPEAVSVTGITTRSVIAGIAEKRALAAATGAEVVDMEAFVVLEALSKRGIAAGVLRVVSDGLEGDLPDLREVFDGRGQLQPLQLAGAFASNPLAGWRLVSGSLQALQVLNAAVGRL